MPACGKCNQSKGNKDWKAWMLGPAPLSPKTRGVSDLDDRLEKLTAYEASTKPTRLEFAEIVGPAEWNSYQQHLDEIQKLMIVAQRQALALRATIRRKHAAQRP